MKIPSSSWLGRLAARYKRSQDGATAVEFALVAGPFFFVLGCICETGLMLFTEYVIQNSVQEAARMVRTGQVSAGDGTIILSSSDFKDKICEGVSIIIDCNGAVNVYVNSATTFAALTTSIADPLTVGVGADGSDYTMVYQPGGQLRASTVIATYDWDFAFPFMDFLGNFRDGRIRRLYGLAVFRNEPFGT
ncbi:TadE/TadG family type IV pilus assembly protein [Aestuariivirga sp.]|uniref:TadE/TadG family type IV pilus assembly protein n=1 Tax=Aestuariivirga sp. TaxID=2650926 RepID=UPI003593B74D